MHSLSAQHFSLWNKRLGLPVVVLGGITASSIFSSTSETSRTWIYINGSLSLITTALSGISGFLGTAEKTSKHQIASFKYTKIGMDIDEILSFPREYREKNPSQFVFQKKSEMMEIRENAPDVLAWVMNHYLKKFDASLVNTTSSINRHHRDVLPDDGRIDTPEEPSVFYGRPPSRNYSNNSRRKDSLIQSALGAYFQRGILRRQTERTASPVTDDTREIDPESAVYNASLQLRREPSNMELDLRTRIRERPLQIELSPERVDRSEQSVHPVQSEQSDSQTEHLDIVVHASNC